MTQTAESGDDDTPHPEMSEALPYFRDARVPALEIDLLSVCVHEIKAARFKYSTDQVTRDKYIYTFSDVNPVGAVDVPWITGVGRDDDPF
ncbi:hypothetical protein BHT19_0026760 [[Kluyvera] intestini]|nr:hypothetical protein BHT19_0026760 [[Kluyvera] intestini]